MKSRFRVISACVCVIIIFGLLFTFYGYEKTWKLWNVFTISPHFADTRIITNSAESYHQGYDPMITIPTDPWNRRLNYPRIWQCLYLLGINESHTTPFGIMLIIMFFTGICLLLPNVNITVLLFVMAAIISPATLLCIERANVDLLMFFLISISVTTVHKRHILAAAAVFFGFILKLYPILGFVVLIGIKRSLFLKYIVLFFIAAILYIGITYSDLLLIADAVPQSLLLTYGMNLIQAHVEISFGPTAGQFAKIASYLVVLSALFVSFTALFRDDFSAERHTENNYLDAFRSGTVIYIGTFLLCRNWDYRLIFLILTVPQLTLWATCEIRKVSLCSIFSLICLFFSLWYSLISLIPIYQRFNLWLDEMFNWGLFVGVLYLLFWSMPHWVKSDARKIRSLFWNVRSFT